MMQISRKFGRRCWQTVLCMHREAIFDIHVCSQYSTINEKSESLTYSENGDPTNVIKKVTTTFDRLNDSDVLIRMLAAPINPADINMVQGVYPVRPKLPAVGGNEGVGKVLKVGSAVSSSHLNVGDWVIPAYSGWGTWRTLAVCPAADVTKIPNDIPLVSAATLSVNPCTAYRMLTDFEKMAAGDVVIQNGSNSGVGQAVIQIAAAMSLQTVNIVRSRPNIESLIATLKNLGAMHVITDEFVRSPEMKSLIKSLPRPPRLALNCVGGKSTADILKYVDKGATLVTYGGMSKQPLMVPAGNLIFNDVKLRGYWMTQWNRDHRDSQEMKDMWRYLGEMVRSGRLKPPLHRAVPFEQYADAIAKAMEPLVTEKQILIMK